MYSIRPNLLLGFHGCDHKTAEQVLSGKTTLKPSENTYDWLGHGIYFWENSPRRARLWAEKHHPKSPSVIGAVLSLGPCLDLLDSQSILVVRSAFEEYHKMAERAGLEIPRNRRVNGELLVRHLDCAVIEYLHSIKKENGEPDYDSVRGTFIEGDPFYENSGFFEKTHIQVSVRNPNCIKGFFRLRDGLESHRIP